MLGSLCHHQNYSTLELGVGNVFFFSPVFVPKYVSSLFERKVYHNEKVLCVASRKEVTPV